MWSSAEWREYFLSHEVPCKPTTPLSPDALGPLRGRVGRAPKR